MNKLTSFLYIAGASSLLYACTMVSAEEKQVMEPLQEKILEQTAIDMESKPATVTCFIAERSAGTKHDFYSEGDYWWPDSLNPDGPYIRRDGETNPDNFVEHRHAMIRFSRIVGNLTSAYLLTGDRQYLDPVIKHLRAWFIDEETRMNPHLLYAQAIKGIATGRGIGIIDVRQMYGAGAVKLTKVIDIVVKLETWDEEKEYDRLGNVQEYYTILDTQLPLYTIPVKPGRNLAAILEVAARNHRLKDMGYDTLTELDSRIRNAKPDER